MNLGMVLKRFGGRFLPLPGERSSALERSAAPQPLSWQPLVMVCPASYMASKDIIVGSAAALTAGWEAFG